MTKFYQILGVMLILGVAHRSAQAACVDLSGVYRFDGQQINCTGDFSAYPPKYFAGSIGIGGMTLEPGAVIRMDQNRCENLILSSSKEMVDDWTGRRMRSAQVFDISINRSEAEYELVNRFEGDKVLMRIENRGTTDIVGFPQTYLFEQVLELNGQGDLVVQVSSGVKGFFRPKHKMTCFLPRIQ